MASASTPSEIEKLTGITLKSEYFDPEATLELFPNTSNGEPSRVSLLYGHTGSGKSTIAQGFREYAEQADPPDGSPADPCK